MKACLCLIAALLLHLPVHAADTPLSRAQVKSKYESCSDGYYSGHRPGKVRYTKDDYLWVVTPEFASRYCMPPEFVDASLKGAEAVAFRLVQEPTENCGFGGNREVCSRRTALGFEIYYKSDLKLPAISDTKYSVAGIYMLPVSKHLLSNNLPYSQVRKETGSAWANERPGFQSKFKKLSFGLVGVKGNRVPWPITALAEIMFIENLMPGYDFISLEGSVGFFTNPRMEKLGIRKFSIVLDKPDEIRKDEDRLYPVDYAHVIDIPEWFTDRIRAADKRKGDEWRSLIQRTLPATAQQ